MTCYQNTRRCRNCVRSCIVLEDKLAQSRDNTSKLSKKKKELVRIEIEKLQDSVENSGKKI